MDSNGADKCPLCSKPNHCAIAAGEPAESCWCMKAEIAPAALAQLAPEDRGVRCICPACGSVSEGEQK
ncbi:hypothetical protein EY643_03680 [Halioglobus maricola]|uniref:DNA or RNA helicase of superfamily II n=1 Tax=Halioglobus maricola TaxID=2601894 RepID=A0A5P9NIK0_9GAMM|nr:cysteine-rich CWC family protein [Halioglobus maricola]QFU74818.1 hypothetical protein EY643_03680 [Halioglobus maricola]